MNQLFQPLDEVFRTRLADAEGTSEDARWVGIFPYPLFAKTHNFLWQFLNLGANTSV